MLTCTRKLYFSAGHRVMGHENVCANIHGHNYMVEVTVSAPTVGQGTDQIGRVVDFGVLKSVCQSWLDDKMDHAFIYAINDGLVSCMFYAIKERAKRIDTREGADWESKQYIMPANPTAENIAQELCARFQMLLIQDAYKHDRPFLVVERVIVHETEKCSATYEIGEYQRHSLILGDQRHRERIEESV